MVPELVIHVDEQNPVDLPLGKLRVIEFAQDGHDAGHTFFFDVSLQDLQHLGLDVHGVDRARRSDDPGHPAREVPGAGSDVRDNVAVLEAHHRHHFVRHLFRNTLGAFEPTRSLVAHERCRDTLGEFYRLRLRRD